MKIAIVGSGWVGCHLANKLKNEHEITIYDKNDDFFSETSSKNQNRLHLGFHYARNYKTRQMCFDTFDKFMDDYSFLVKDVERNIYCIPKNDSIIDFETYSSIFRNFNYEVYELNSIKNIEGSINTYEKYIDFEKAKVYFKSHLKKFFINEEIDINKIKTKFDLIINATNNQITALNFKNYFYELTLSLIYKKINKTEFDGLTLVDGNFFSIYPYKDDLYTLTDVQHTPIKKYKKYNKIINFLSNSLNHHDIISIKRELMEQKVTRYYPTFCSDFKYEDYFFSIKCKPYDLSDSRFPIITTDDNIINCFTGKIQGIYIIETYIKNEINNRKYRINR